MSDDLHTLRDETAVHLDAATGGIALTIAAHADSARVGDVAYLDEIGNGMLSRQQPLFRAPRSARAEPLADRFLSRKPLELRQVDGSVEVRRGVFPDPVTIDGVALGATARISPEQLLRGVVLCLAGRVVLVMHYQERVEASDVPPLGMVGESDAIQLVRAQILQVAELSVPVLVRGPSGSGKELVASAIHAAGARVAGPFLAVSMAAVTPTTAASELFGHVKGAFTGAVRDHDGHFRRANGGTLFLDEIGDAPSDLQASLLRVLETKEVTPVGGQVSHQVDVRLIAATDAVLERAIQEGTFRLPLFHRLTGYQIHVPPLCERREDVGRLLIFLLRRELEDSGAADLLHPPDGGAKPWLRADVVERFLLYDWPGNVRQLHNAVRHLVIAGRKAPRARLDPTLEALLCTLPESEAAHHPQPVAGSSGASAAPADLSDEQLREALRAHGWQLGAAAKALGIARSSMYRLVETNSAFRQAKDLSREELAAAMARAEGDVAQVSQELEVSARGLRLRMKELGLEE